MSDSIAHTVAKIKSGELSAVAVVTEALERAKTDNHNAVIELLEDSALSHARKIDEAIAAGTEVGPLAGIPYVAKDNYLTHDGHTTAASNILKPFVAPYQATAVNKLEEAGAILIGKANLDAFAHGGSTENSDFGPTTNPADSTRVAGGSSGGPVAAVAAGIVPFALGTDTGGSIREPSSFCGVVGLKPTYGLISRYGVIAMASSTDCLGPIAKTVVDAALVLDVMAGRDARDGTSIERDEVSYTNLEENLTGKKFGLIKQYMAEGVDEAVRSAVLAAAETIKAAGGEVVDVDLPALELALACYYIIVPAEISSNLGRYDGVRYGLSSSTGRDLNDVYEQTREEGFNAENKRRIMIGTFVTGSGYHDAYYLKAQTVRSKLIAEFAKAFEVADFLIGPVAPTPAFKLGELTADPLQMYLIDIMTVAANLVGVPSISIPLPVDELPIGLQIMAPQRQDRSVLASAKSLEEKLR